MSDNRQLFGEDRLREQEVLNLHDDLPGYVITKHGATSLAPLGVQAQRATSFAAASLGSNDATTSLDRSDEP